MDINNELTRKTFLKLHEIYGIHPIFDLLAYEIIYQGSRDQLKEAVKMLEIIGIDYMVDWKQSHNVMDGYVLMLKVDVVSLKIQRVTS